MSAKKNILCAKNKKKINGLKMNLIYYKIMNQVNNRNQIKNFYI